MMQRVVARKPPPGPAEPVRSSSALRISKPGDPFEQEADRVADAVLSGKRAPNWSIARVGTSAVQRDTPEDPGQPQPQEPRPNNYDEAGKKILEAAMKTDAGRKVVDRVEKDPLVRDLKDFVTSTPGMIITGTAAAGVVAGLTAAHKPLPMQIPAVPVDSVIPALKGVKAQINVQGPLNHPTQFTVGFSGTFGGGEKKKKKKDDTPEKIAKDKESLRESMDMFKPKPQGPGPSEDVGELLKLGKGAATPGFGMEDFGKPRPFALPGTQGTPLAPAQQPNQQTAGKLADAPLASPVGKDTPEKKREEQVPVQRKACACEPAFADGADLEAGLRSSSRPLDTGTRRFMESRFGFDFGKVRIHTGGDASRSARALGALAYTVGDSIVFGAEHFAPSSAEGRRLLAHELTHVVQQTQPAPKAKLIPMPVQRAPIHVQRDEEESSSSWLLHPIETLKAKIRKIPGYKLFTVILAEDPLTGEKVVRDATSLARGVLELVPGGTALFDRIMESGAVQKVFDWLNHELDSLGLSWDYVKGLIHQVADSVHASDLFNLDEAFGRIARILNPAYEKLKQFAKDAFDKSCELIVEVVMDRLGGARILQILRKAGDTFLTVVKDPVGFLKNLLAALGQGFNQFKDHVLEHLKKGVVEWLFGAIEQAGIRLPKKYDFAGIVNLILQVLGISWGLFRKKLVGLIGEKAVGYLETAFDFIAEIAQAKDLSVIWKRILAEGDNLIDTVLGSVKQWAVTKIITSAILKLATMFNPVGAVVQAIETIYHTIKFFIDKAKQLASLIEAISEAISAIAGGNLTQAADFVERSMAKTIPPVLGFLAELIGLGDIGEQLRKVIKALQEKVSKAIDKVLDWVVQKFKALYAKAKDAVGQVIAWWQQRREVRVGGESHTVYMEGTEEEPHLMIASTPGQRWSEYLDKHKKDVDEDDEDLFKETREKAEQVEQRLKPSTNDEERAKRIEEKRALFSEIADNIVALGFTDQKKDPASIIHYDEPGPDDRGVRAEARILSKKHPPGTDVQDKPPIWKKLGPLQDNYVQGHLLNNNLGGVGRRFNLTPITYSANTTFSARVEEPIKEAVKDGKVVYYEVKAIYPPNPIKSKDDDQLGGEPKKMSAAERKEYVDRMLCTELEYDIYELQFKRGEWVKNSKAKKDQDSTPLPPSGSLSTR